MSDVTTLQTDQINGSDVIPEKSWGEILTMGVGTYLIDKVDTNGYYRVFRHAVMHDLIGEGLPSAVGFVGDVGHGLVGSAVDLVTEGDFTNPFNRVTRSDGYTARMGRWGSENIGQHLADWSGAGDVEFRTPDGGGLLDKEYKVDKGAWREADAGILTVKVAGNVADVVVPGLLATKLRHLGKLGSAAQMTGYGLVAGGFTGLIWDAVDTGDANDFIALLNDHDALNGERGIRALQRSLNEVNKDQINQSIEKVNRNQRLVREGEIVGDEALNAMDRTPLEFLDDHGLIDSKTSLALQSAATLIEDRDVLANKAMSASSYFGADFVEAHLNMLVLEQNAYKLIHDYYNDPKGFNPNQSELLTLQTWMSGSDSEVSLDGFGELGRESTLSSIDGYMQRQIEEQYEMSREGAPPRDVDIDDSGFDTTVNPNAAFNKNAERVMTVEEFLDHKQSQLGTDIAANVQKSNDFIIEEHNVHLSMTLGKI